MPRKGPLANLSDAHREIIADLYAQCRLTRDDLPYTDEFDQLHAAFIAKTGKQITRHELWRALATIGKTIGLKRKER